MKKPDNKYTRQNGFVMIQNDLFKMGLDPYAFMIYVYLASKANKDGECWPSIPTMASVLNLSPTTVQKRLKWLEENRYIYIFHKSGLSDKGLPMTFNNHYIVNDFEKPWAYYFFEHKRLLERIRQQECPLDDIDF